MKKTVCVLLAVLVLAAGEYEKTADALLAVQGQS